MGRRKLIKATTRRKLRGWLIRPRLSWQKHRAAIQSERAAVIKKRQKAEWDIAQNRYGRAGERMAQRGVPTLAEMRTEAEAQNQANPFGGWAITQPGESLPANYNNWYGTPPVQQSRNGKVFSNDGSRHPNAGKPCGAKTQAGGKCRYHLGDDGKCRIDAHNSRR